MEERKTTWPVLTCQVVLNADEQGHTSLGLARGHRSLFPSCTIMQPNMNPQTQSRTGKLPALLEIVLWLSQYEKKIEFCSLVTILYSKVHCGMKRKPGLGGKDYSVNGIGNKG